MAMSKITEMSNMWTKVYVYLYNFDQQFRVYSTRNLPSLQNTSGSPTAYNQPNFTGPVSMPVNTWTLLLGANNARTKFVVGPPSGFPATSSWLISFGSNDGTTNTGGSVTPMFSFLGNTTYSEQQNFEWQAITTSAIYIYNEDSVARGFYAIEWDM